MTIGSMCASANGSWDGQDAHDLCAAELRNRGRKARSIGMKHGRSSMVNAIKLQVFAMRSMASGAAIHRAYQRATQQAFLEAHEHAFQLFCGESFASSEVRQPEKPR